VFLSDVWEPPKTLWDKEYPGKKGGRRIQMRWTLLILLVLLVSCVFTNHSPNEDTIAYSLNPPSSIVLSYNLWREKYDYRDWKILYYIDRGYIYDEWMEPYGSKCVFGDFRVYRWVGLPKVYDTLEECEKTKRLL